MQGKHHVAQKLRTTGDEESTWEILIFFPSRLLIEMLGIFCEK
jgi:hypothetical protein